VVSKSISTQPEAGNAGQDTGNATVPARNFQPRFGLADDDVIVGHPSDIITAAPEDEAVADGGHVLKLAAGERTGWKPMAVIRYEYSISAEKFSD
jgi:hypothetical protein